MESNPAERRDFIPYPTNRVVGTVADAKAARATIDALLQAGFAREDIDILHGEAGTPLAADILNAHGAEFVGFYGRWAREGLTTDARPSTETVASGQAHDVATRPEEIPSLFVEAWNSRNPDALASLFDEDAEFVNVTGLWWHDRAAIRKAHAYGLERLFSESTLTIDDARIKALSVDLAVVHARMTLSGQTSVSTITAPGSRRTIFSFVVHRVRDRWQCASAQNTDVVPGMETNVVGDEGRLRSANYLTGELSE